VDAGLGGKSRVDPRPFEGAAVFGTSVDEKAADYGYEKVQSANRIFRIIR